MYSLCGISCTVSKERQNWLKNGSFVKGPDSALEGTYENRGLWTIISEQSEKGDSVQLRLKYRNKLQFTLLEKGNPVAVEDRRLKWRESHWSVGSKYRLQGIPPFVWAYTDNEVGLAVDSEGNLHTSNASAGGAFIGLFGFVGGSGREYSDKHLRISK